MARDKTQSQAQRILWNQGCTKESGSDPVELWGGVDRGQEEQCHLTGHDNKV